MEGVETVFLGDGCGAGFLAEETDVAEGDEGIRFVFVRVVFGEDGGRGRRSRSGCKSLCSLCRF